jgi:nucleotide-binding universal stress UspA family protein
LGANRPTLTVGPLVPELVGSRISCEKVIYVSDLSVASIAAATFAAALGKPFNAEIEVHQLVSKATIEDAPRLRNLAAQYCDLASFADPDLPPSWFDIDFQSSRIVAEDEFLATLSKSGNLIVMGVQPASFLQRRLHTSLAYRLLSSAASPVLTIPAEVLLKKSQ